MAQHIAFKCTYNNADEGPLVGFNGTCSEDIIRRNIEDGRVWCGQSECAQYCRQGFGGRRPVDPCYESVLFRDWRYGAGMYHMGSMAGTRTHLHRIGVGKIAVLTTRFPVDREIDRKIVGLFQVGRVIDEPGSETIVEAEDEFRVRLPLDISSELYFWDYYGDIRTERAVWGSHLHRYLSDVQVAQILVAIRDAVRNNDIKGEMDELLAGLSLDLDSARPPSGPRISLSGEIVRRAGIRRKYSPGGEGDNHRRLKEWVAKHPMCIGLRDVVTTEVESHVFPSGDLPDIVFTCASGQRIAVEVETQYPRPGAYQAIKYRTLLCAEAREPIAACENGAILVA